MEGIQKGLKSKKLSSYQKLKEKHEHEKLKLLNDIKILVSRHPESAALALEYTWKFYKEDAFWFKSIK